MKKAISILIFSCILISFSNVEVMAQTPGRRVVKHSNRKQVSIKKYTSNNTNYTPVNKTIQEEVQVEKVEKKENTPTITQSSSPSSNISPTPSTTYQNNRQSSGKK